MTSLQISPLIADPHPLHAVVVHTLAVGGTDGGTITQIFAGIAAVAGVWLGYRTNKRNNDAEELKVTKKKLADLQKDVQTMARYVHSLRTQVAIDHGVDTPEPPHLLSEDW